MGEKGKCAPQKQNQIKSIVSEFESQTYLYLCQLLSYRFVLLRRMNSAFQPQIILLREGTDTSQGKAQIISNINACQAVAETVRTTLGPRGMDKLVFDGQRTTISNDGATIMRLLDIVHPAAKTLVDISMAQVRFRRI